jgi:hypothetical protein
MSPLNLIASLKNDFVMAVTAAKFVISSLSCRRWVATFSLSGHRSRGCRKAPQPAAPQSLSPGSAQSNSVFDIDPRVRISGMTGAPHQRDILQVQESQSFAPQA